MKKLLIIILLASSLFAQTKLDSLLTKIEKESIPKKIEALNNFIWNYRNISPKEAVRATELTFKMSEDIGDNHNRARALNFLSVIYRDEGKYERSIALCTKALEIALFANDWKEKAYSYNNIGTIYRLKGNYPLALDYIYKALKVFEDKKDSEGKAFCTYNIGFVYLRQSNYRKALEYLEQTVKLREMINDHEGAIKAEGRVAEVYVELGNYQKALNIYQTVKNYYENLSDQKSLISVLDGIAKVYEKTKDYSRALIERKKALLTSKIFNEVDGIVTNSSLIGVLEAHLGNYSEGKRYLDSALSVSNKYKSSVFKIRVYKGYADFYESQSNYSQAYRYLKLFNQERDSISLQEKRSVIAEVEYAYKYNKKEREKELIQRDLQNQKTIIDYWIGISGVLVVLAVIIIFLYYSRGRANKKLTELNTLKDKFFGIIAHDLKNPFNVLLNYSQILIEEKETLNEDEKSKIVESVAETSQNAYKLLENLLYWSQSQTNRLQVNPEKISLKQIVDEVLLLFAGHAKQKGIVIESQINEKHEVLADVDLLKTILRNLLSNGIKFTKKGERVSITSFEEESYCKIVIADNGIGIGQETIDILFTVENINSAEGTDGEKGTGLGLVLCKEFIEKLGGKIWAEPNLPKGSKFIFTLPLGK